MTDFPTLRDRLKSKGVRFAPGLTDSELKKIESTHRFIFPEDLREFLSIGLPVSEGWMDWRSDQAAQSKRINRPLEGIHFDVEHNQFWLPAFGPQPLSLTDRLQVVSEHLKQAPKLIPIYSHRYMPDNPTQRCNPIFSVQQSDIIIYGKNLADYLAVEFELAPVSSNKSVRHIQFWSDLAN